jgi:hypothetical protein
MFPLIRKPIDKESALLIAEQGGDASYRFSVKPRTILTMTYMPPTKPRPRNAPKYEGLRLDRMTIIKYSHGHRKRGSIWIARCDCGFYEYRTGRSIKRALNGDTQGESENMCKYCDKTKHQKEYAHSEINCKEG